MQKIFDRSSFIVAIVLGFILLTPFIALELINRWKFNEDFPFAIFIFSWFLQSLFILILIPIINNVRSGKSLTKHPINLLLRVLGLIVITNIWAAGLLISGLA